MFDKDWLLGCHLAFLTIDEEIESFPLKETSSRVSGESSRVSCAERWMY